MVLPISSLYGIRTRVWRMAVKEKVVRVFTPPSFEGVTSIAVLEELLKDAEDVQLDVQYTGHIDFSDYTQFSEANVVLVLGLPYKGFTLPEVFFTAVDNPFTEFIHLSTYGEAIQGQYLVSEVNEGADPIWQLSNLLQYKPGSSILGTYVSFTDKATYMIQAVNAYRTWTWANNNTTKMLLALYQGSFKWLPHMTRGLSLQEVIEKYAPVIKGQMQKQADYLERKKEVVKVYDTCIQGTDCILKVVFAEEYINELANELLNIEHTAKPVIVCVGRSTKGSDMFSIRTKGIHAGQVAHWINEGNGKENVGSVFTGMSYAELMASGMLKAFSQLDSE